MKLLSLLASCAAISSLTLFSSCSNSDSDTQSTEEGALGASPILVTDVEFYAGRYAFDFVTHSGKIVRITPLGSGTGGDTPGVMTVDELSVNVTLAYELDGDFLDLTGDNPTGDAIGNMTLRFVDLGQPALDFFERLGVTFDGAAEGEEFALPAGSGFLVRVFYLNPDGTNQVATVSAFAPLSTQLASWTSRQGVNNTGTFVERWLEADFLQGAYNIKRNF